MTVPPNPGAHFILVEASLLLGLFEAFFDRPAATGYLHEFLKRGAPRRISEIERMLAGLLETASYQASSGVRLLLVMGPGQECPIIFPLPLRAGTTREAVPRVSWNLR